MDWLLALLHRPPITWWDVLDILIVSILIYEALKLIRRNGKSVRHLRFDE